MSDHIAIILLNWNGKADTLECLASLQADACPGAHVIVVDNGSADDSVAAIRQAYPAITVIETHKNLGFTGGNNVGIAHAIRHGFQFIYLLNNDTTVQPGSTATLAAALTADASAGMACPVMNYYAHPSEPWFAGAALDLSTGTAVHDNSQPPASSDAPRTMPWATGCAMMLRADILRQLGGFDDRFFLNWEDVDLSLRMKALGWRIVLVPGARILHKVSRSLSTNSPVATYYYVRNNLLFVRVHCGRTLSVTLRTIARNLRRGLVSLRRGEPQASRTAYMILRAIFDHLRGRYGPLQTARF